jgi:hypothetical protein
MAWADTAYVTAATYRDKNGRVSTDFDTSLSALAVAVSRLYDRRMGVAPAHFAPQTAVTATFVGHGENLLRLRDERGWQHFLRTVDANAIDIDSEADGTFDGYQLDLADAWVRGYPVNAATFGEPYTALELLPGVASADPTRWTNGVEVRITGNWGWAATPGAVVHRCSNIMRELVEVGFGGPTVDIEALEAAAYSNRSVVALLEQGYSYRIPSFA